MTFDPRNSMADISRRRLLHLAMIGGGAIVAATLPTGSMAATKVGKSAVAYQDKPKGKAQCSNCTQWQAPNACKLVTGVISPTGWCSIYMAKA
ncbi:MAG: high-potential iron-sulfur protein [Pseudomonadota bacterium]|nr:high-potential iron-sulfur protein [Pseudomonadota bacterium]